MDTMEESYNQDILKKCFKFQQFNMDTNFKQNISTDILHLSLTEVKTKFL